MNLDTHVTTLKNFQHVVTINDLFELICCPMVSDPVRESATLYGVAGEVSLVIHGVYLPNRARFPTIAALSSLAVPLSRFPLA